MYVYMYVRVLYVCMDVYMYISMYVYGMYETVYERKFDSYSLTAILFYYA